MRTPKTISAADAIHAAAAGLPVVVLVGRANAGKSTLFNRLAGASRAIVSPIAGTTRDLNIARVRHDDREFLLVDSGGLELGEAGILTERVVAEALAAVASADVVVFILDGRAGLGAADAEAFALIRETGRPLLAAVNKIDRPAMETRAAEFYALGADHLAFISSAHGLGVGELFDEAIARLPAGEAVAAAAPDLRVALIGRPNVGKSSLLNALVGFSRSIVDAAPGTTRDPVDVRLSHKGRDVLLIDTAGIRRPTRVEGELEHHAVGRAIGTIRRAEVLFLVIDATEGITDQDARLARLIVSEGRALVVVCNKWDAAAKAGAKVAAFRRDAAERFAFLEFAPMVFTSALTGDGVDTIIPAALKAGDAFRATFQTAQLNRILSEAGSAMDPPMVAGRRLNLMYVTQVASSPPRFVFFANLERDIPAHYARFLEGRFRAKLDLQGTPIGLEFRRARGSHEAGERASDVRAARRLARR
jgi:GTP-binding protein